VEQKNIEEMSRGELEKFTDELLANFNPDSWEDTELLERCYAALGLPEEAVWFSEKQYLAMAEAVINTFEASTLKPGDPEHCPGLGLDPNVECQCDGCDHLMDCCGKFPDGVLPKKAPAERPWWKTK